VDWVAVKSKYFTVALLPDGDTRGAELLGERFGDVGGAYLRHDYVASLAMPAVSDGSDRFRMYIGPIQYSRLNDYGAELYDMVDYGWDFFEFITRPLAKFVFIPVFNLLGGILPNYGLVIIVLAILIKMVVYPLTKTSFKSMAKMKELQPRMEAIKEKYPDDPQKQQQAMMKMYKETGVNPLGGCLPMLLQYPIIIALWQFLPQAIEIRQQGFLWAADLSAPDIILHLPFDIPFYGSAVAGFTLLMGISMVVQMRLQMSPGSNPQAKVFTYVMPVMIFVIFNGLASGLNLYYLCYNVTTAAQQRWINRQLEHEKDENGDADAGGGKKRIGKGRKKKRG
jgi:YidC/Oxa1 family membrane protein insertase